MAAVIELETPHCGRRFRRPPVSGEAEAAARLSSMDTTIVATAAKAQTSSLVTVSRSSMLIVAAIALLILGSFYLLYSIAGSSIVYVPENPVLAVLGMVLIAFGIFCGFQIHRVANQELHQSSQRAANVLSGTGNRESLTETIALEGDQLIEQVTGLNEKIMAKTVALMLHEYRDAKDSEDRRDALEKTVNLLDKLTNRMTPWHVRYQSVLAFFVTDVGFISGVISIVSSFWAQVPVRSCALSAPSRSLGSSWRDPRGWLILRCCRRLSYSISPRARASSARCPDKIFIMP